MTSDTHTAQTLDRGLQVMEILARAEKYLTISEISQELKVHRTIGHRLVATLARRELVSRDLEGRYRLGVGLVRLAGAVGSELRTIARPFLQALNAETDETIHMAILSGTNVVIVDAYESSETVRIAPRVGRVVPAHASSMGKAILATLKDEDLLAMFPNSRLAKRTPQTVKTRAELLSELQKTRERGYATNIEESEIGLGSVAAAIIDRHGTTQAALSVAAPIGRFTASTIPRLVKAAQQAAKAIGSQL